MCPIATESKNPKSRSKKKINKNIDLTAVNQMESVKNLAGEVHNQKSDSEKESLDNSEYSLTDEEAKNLGNIKLGPKGTYTEDSIRVYLQEIGRIRLLRPDEEIELARKMKLELIEVQSGTYLDEEDIIRFEDSYGRIKEEY